jgi:hypothetical protein
MSDTPKKEDDKKTPKKEDDKKPAKPKGTEISDKDLGEATGGMTPRHTVRPTEISGIKGPSWTNLMTYRKTGAASEPSANRSVSELFEELSAEKDAG